MSKFVICLLNIAMILAISTTSTKNNALAVATKPDGSTSQLNFIVKVEGKSFFADFYTRGNWTEANKYCESFGMQLASISTRGEYRALNESYNVDNFRGAHWTSATDSQLHRQFSWNPSQEMPGEYIPYWNVFPAIRTCLIFSSQKEDSFLASLPCSDPIGVLCETY